MHNDRKILNFTILLSTDAGLTDNADFICKCKVRQNYVEKVGKYDFLGGIYVTLRQIFMAKKQRREIFAPLLYVGLKKLFFGVLFGVVFEEFFLHVRGNEFVRSELHSERRATACDRAQRSRVA